MRIGRVHAVQNTLAPIGLAIAVGIAREPDVRRLYDDHAIFIELESGRAIQVVQEVCAFVGLAIAICVLEDKQAVTLLAERFAFRIIRPGGDPKAALRIKGHLNGLGEFGKFFFGREEVHLATFGHLHVLDRFLAAEEDVRTVGIWTRFIAFHFDGRREIVVFHHEIAALRHRPNPFVAIGSHHIAHFHFAQERVTVHHAVELEMRTATIDVVAIDGAIAFKELFVLFVDCGDELLERGAIHAPSRFIEERLIHGRRQRFIPGVVQVKRVNSKRLFGLVVAFVRSSEQIDELHAVGFRDVGHGAGIIFNVRIVRGGIDEVRVRMLFLRDWRKQHQTRRTSAAVILFEGVFNELVEIIAEFLQAIVAFVRFVVAKKRKDHISLFFLQPVIRRAEIFRAQSNSNLVTGEAEIAEHQLVRGELRMNQRLQVA